jgi:hypothetical protein
MQRAILAIATAATLAVGTLSVPTTSDARCRGCGVGAGIAAGVIGGVIIGGAIANSQPRYYGPAPGYVVYEGYAAPCTTAGAISSAGAARASSARKGLGNERVTNLGA